MTGPLPLDDEVDLLLHDLRSWIRGLVYRPSELIEAEGREYIDRINNALGVVNITIPTDKRESDR